MTADELIAAASNCLICGKEHPERRVFSGRNGFVTTHEMDGHHPQHLDPAIINQLRNIAASTITAKPARTRKASK